MMHFFSLQNNCSLDSYPVLRCATLQVEPQNVALQARREAAGKPKGALALTVKRLGALPCISWTIDMVYIYIYTNCEYA